jgi:hypothetical protein
LKKERLVCVQLRDRKESEGVKKMTMLLLGKGFG